MNEMIERVSKSLALCYLKARLGDVTVSDEKLMRAVNICYCEWVDAAKLVIHSMREPTEHMCSIDAPDMPAGGSVKEIWRDMIDKVLNND